MTKGAVSAEISDISVSYNISDMGVLTARADISVNITLSDSSGFNALTALSVDDSAKKQRDGDYAVKLYFGTDKENIWDIAKRFSTEVEAIMEENDLSDTTLENGRMLLIPIKE
jgi:LysM repeat protein